MPPLVVTETVTAPGEPAGVTAVTLVGVIAMIEALVPPNRTELVPPRLVPAIVTKSPPVVPPVFGEIEVIVGAATW